MDKDISEYVGLTKRELFAAMAMQGLLANPHNHSFNPGTVALGSLAMADALLKELGKD